MKIVGTSVHGAAKEDYGPTPIIEELAPQIEA